MASKKNRLSPLTQWPSEHPWPPLGGLRHLIFHAETNGFDAVVVRIGRRVLIDEAAFFVFAGQHRGQPGSQPPIAGGKRPGTRGRKFT